MTTFEFCGIVDSAYFEEAIAMLKCHKYKIRQDKDGRWSTYVRKEGEDRKLIRKSSKEELVKALKEFYAYGGRTFKDIYKEWRSYHDKMVCNNSISKYDSDEKRYFSQGQFLEKQMKTLTEDDVKVFIKETIDEQKLCKSASKKLFYYVKDTFDFAFRHNYITVNPIVNLSAKDFYKYASGTTRVKHPTIKEEDLARLLAKYDADLVKNPNYIPLYALKLAALTGMRAGELAGLKWEDVKGAYILVRRSQKYDPATREYYISDTKTGNERVFPITEKIRALLNTLRLINGSSLYLFGNGDEPTTYRILCSCMKNKCRQIGMASHGIHDYRRTVNSMMARNGVPVTTRAALLGHSEAVNLKYYTYDISGLEEKMAVIEKVNTQMNTDEKEDA